MRGIINEFTDLYIYLTTYTLQCDCVRYQGLTGTRHTSPTGRSLPSPAWTQVTHATLPVSELRGAETYPAQIYSTGCGKI